MSKLAVVQSLVRKQLEISPATRDNDIDLYLAICEDLNPLVTKNFSFEYVMKNRDALGLPNYDSVSRCRRKIQEYDESLRASKRCDDARFESFKEYREYAQS